MTISANGIGNVDIKMQKSVGSSKEEKQSADVFADLLNMTAAKSDIETAKTPNTDYKQKDTNSVNDADNMADKFLSTVVKANVKKDDKKIDDGVLDEVKNAVKDALGISDEEMEEILAELGIDVSDFFDVGVLKEFVLNAEASTEIDLLLDENLSSLYENVTNAVTDILAEHGLDLTEINELMSQIEYNMDLTKDASEISIEDNQNVEVKDAMAEQPMIDEQSQNTDVIAEDTGIEVTPNTVDVENFSENGSEMQDGHGDNENIENNIVSNMKQALDSAMQVEETDGNITYSDVDMQADIVRQVVDSIKVNISKENSSITVQLNPENLGKVQVSVANRNGVMQAQIIAENESARHAIENNIALLKEAFDNHELKVDAVEVMVASQDFFNGNHETGYEEEKHGNVPTGNTSLNVNGDIDEDELTEDDKLTVSMMKVRGNSVSYSI